MEEATSVTDEVPIPLFEQPVNPVCPYCLMEPALMKALGPYSLGQLHVVVIFCGNLDCRKVWTVEVIGKEQPRVITEPNSRFAR